MVYGMCMMSPDDIFVLSGSLGLCFSVGSQVLMTFNMQAHTSYIPSRGGKNKIKIIIIIINT